MGNKKIKILSRSVLGAFLGLACLSGCAGEAGAPGTKWYSGAEDPTSSLGRVGDFYFETDDCDVWEKTKSGWIVISNAKGDTGPQGNPGTPGQTGPQGNPGAPGATGSSPVITIENGVWVINGVPTTVKAEGTPGATGEAGSIWSVGTSYPTNPKEKDMFLNNLTWDIYQYEDDEWVLKGNIKPSDGQNGTNGSSFLTGSGVPAASLGNDGDVYLDESTYELYKKVSGTWGTIGNIKGEDGTSTEANNPLKGKSILAIGDSYVYGHTSPSSDTWISQLAERNGMTKYVHAQNGISVAGNNGIVSKIDNYLSGVAKTDYIVFLAGHNDANASLNGGSPIPVGTNDDKTASTYKGALNIIIEKLLNKYPTAKILFLTPFERYGTEEAYVTAMQEVCAKWSIPCFDNYHASGISWQNAAQKEQYESANLHFNRAGHERISYMYESILKNHLVINVGGGNGGSSTGGSGGSTEDNTETPDTPITSLKFELASSGGGTNNRAVDYIELEAGTTVSFADETSWSKYKFAIALDDDWQGAQWVGGGYIPTNGSHTVSTAGTYTIMIAKQVDGTFTTAELEELESIMKFEKGTSSETPETPELEENQVLFNGQVLDVVDNVEDLVLVKDATIQGASNLVFGSAIGRATSQTNVLKNTSTMTLSLTNEAKTKGVSFLVYTFSDATMDANSLIRNTSYSQDAVNIAENEKYVMIIFKNGDGSTSFSDDELLLLPTYLSVGEETEEEPGETEAFVWNSDFSAFSEKRAGTTATIKAGTKINFADPTTWETYKYAIGPGTNSMATQWIGGGYQNGECTIPSDGIYTIMIARQDDQPISIQDMAAFKDLFIIG